ncbi:hypothetical protein [Luteimonas terrae]|uniref:KfrA N-terminal DNA-binding domain-containing protein n=1 Tax=Luteimonas terrae TaxID=1530191 RepID=A0ABU1XZ88_9GAMM|nr:hypothetical protein [Luteimonas terrae]MDR7193386.1 hypothetical protein [Luteimonas terrae]
MSIRHDVYSEVVAMGAPGRTALVARLMARGLSMRSAQTTISDMIATGQLLCGAGRALNRTLRPGRPPVLRKINPETAARRAALAQSPLGRERVNESTSALQPIWPAVNGAPIGGLRPCIA